MPYDDIPASLPSMLASYLHMDEPSDAQKSLGALSLKDVMARPAHSGGQAPAAVPPQMAAPRISPRMPANLDGAPSLATPAQIPSDAPVLTDVSPQAQPAPALTAGANTGARPPKPPPVDDLAEAQAEAAHQRKLIGVGGLMAHAADVSRGADTSATDKLYAGMAAQADQPVKDLLQKHERLQQMQAEQAQKDLADPNSDISKRTQPLMAALGIPGADGLSAADYQRMAPLIKDGMDGKKAREALDAEKERQAKEIGSREKEGALGRRNQLQLERERMAAEYKMHMDEVRAKQAAEKGLKPLPAEVNQKIAGTTAGASALNDVWDKFDTVGKLAGAATGASEVPVLGHLIPTGRNVHEYEDLSKNKASPIAVAELPNARETPQLVEEFGKKLPTASDSKERAAQNIMGHFQNMETKLQGEILANQGQYDVSGIQRELAGVQSEKAKFLAKSGLGKATGSDLKPGEVKMVDPKGVPHAVHESEVAESESHGWKRS